jgi:hypothetical protein
MSIQIFLPKLPARRTSPTGNETTQLSLSCTGSRSLMPLLAVSRSVVCCLPKELKGFTAATIFPLWRAGLTTEGCQQSGESVRAVAQ